MNKSCRQKLCTHRHVCKQRRIPMDAHNDINFHRYSHTVQPLLGPKSERDQRLLELL